MKLMAVDFMEKHASSGQSNASCSGCIEMRGLSEMSLSRWLIPPKDYDFSTSRDTNVRKAAEILSLVYKCRQAL